MQTKTNTSAQSLKDISTHPQINRVKPLVHRNWWLFFPLVLLTLFLTIASSQAQPQTPITWGQLRVLQTLPSPRYGVSIIKAQGDTIVLVAGLEINNSSFATISISGNNGLTWSPWRTLYPDTTTNGISYTNSVAISQDGIYAVELTLPPGIGIYRTTNLGQTWINPTITQTDNIRLQGNTHDTLLCTKSQAGTGTGISYATNFGQTFAPSRFPFGNVQNIGSTEQCLSYSPPYLHFVMCPYYPESQTPAVTHYTRGLLTGGTFSTPVNLNPDLIQELVPTIGSDEFGTIVVFSNSDYGPIGMGPVYVFDRISYDSGFTWTNRTQINPYRSSDQFKIIQRNQGKYWIETWGDTTISPGYSSYGNWYRFSANRAKSWYPIRQAFGDSTYYPTGLVYEIDITGNLIRMYLPVGFGGDTQFSFCQLEWEIHPDSLPPNLFSPTILPSTVLTSYDRYPISCSGFDNDSLWRIQCIVKRINQVDSTIITLIRSGVQSFSGMLQIPQDTGRYSYYYRGEDMWENVRHIPTAGPAAPFTFSVVNTGTNDFGLLPIYHEFKVFPNPGNQQFTFQIPGDLTQQAQLGIYDLQGRTVWQMILSHSPHRTIVWDGKDTDGTFVASGVYLVTLELNQAKRYALRLAVVR